VFRLFAGGTGTRPTEEPLVTVVLPLPRAAEHAERVATPRRYLMCPPEHFSVDYAINPWMDVARGTDRALAMRQWETLRRTYVELGHECSSSTPSRGCPTWSSPRTVAW
jgi:hypothetical protein